MGSHGSPIPVAAIPDSVPAPPPLPAKAWTEDHPNNSTPKRTETSSSSFTPTPNAYAMEPDTRPTEQRLEEILLGAGDENVKSDKILTLLTNATPEAQVELSQHLINM